jgi:hypothetical protein
MKDQFDRALAGARVTERAVSTIGHDRCVYVWEIAAPHTWVRLIFTDGPRTAHQQIVVTGDFVGSTNGWVSVFGYGAGWFGRLQGEDCLCSKFMSRVWVPERAAALLLDQALEALDEVAAYGEEIAAGRQDEIFVEGLSEAKARFEALDAALLDHEDGRAGDVCRSSEAFYTFDVEELHGDGDVCGAGVGYDPSEAARLCAIQRMFVRLSEAAT